MMEQWKPIPGYEGRYEVSDHGNVRSVDREVKMYTDFHGHFIRPRKGKPMVCKGDKDGYEEVGLYDDSGKRRFHRVHRLMLLTFVGPPKDSTIQCNHKDGIKYNNTLDNLEWATPSENRQHSYDIGLESQVGSRNARSKLTEKDVVRIRREFSRGRADRFQLAKQFNVTAKHIWAIVNGKRWPHVPMP